MSWMVRGTKTASGHAPATALGQAVGGCLLAALVLGACSGGGSVSAAQEDQAKKADAICVDTQDAVGKTLGDEPDKEQAALKTAVDKLMALKPPSENETIWTQFTGEMNNLWLDMLDVSQSLDPAVNDRPRAQRALDRAKGSNQEVIRLATKYHALECAKGFGRT